ncbi:GNAT family N-acetyltransferase [Nonomuraea sp. SBT364]|uniref:GNAT family N-acetyltransferase n=1 Tax=Nonomuraea sp. SBT364 TaxID=1580530 RepID=UPI00066EDDC0|nr:GNAT family N-acetyltransferase [Nonomuraea sp. SBT364]
MHTLSRPRREDAAAIHELIVARDVAVLGVPDVTLDDVLGELAEPAFDLGADGWLARGADGRPDGWAWACASGDGDVVDVEVIVRPGVTGLAERLWPLVLGRAAELGRARGHASASADVGVYRTDEAQRALVRSYGFEPGTSFYRMRADFDGPVEPPPVPAGLTLETGESDDVRRRAHRVHQEGFADHFGFTPSGYDHWYERRQAHNATDWSQLTLVSVDGEPAAVCIGNDQFAADEGCGYVATLAVLPAFRGRGLGRFLLRHAFAADAARGRKGTILHVDSNNTTPALGLYESAGMRPVMVIDVWRRQV